MHAAQATRTSPKFEDSAFFRVPCQPDTVVGHHFHKHQCPMCQHTWAHLDVLPELTSKEEFNIAHSCSECGHTGVVDKFFANSIEKHEALIHALFAVA